MSSENNQKTDEIKKSLATLLEQLRVEKGKANVYMEGLAKSSLQCHRDIQAFDKGIHALESLQALSINSLQFVKRLRKINRFFLSSSTLHVYPLPDFRSVIHPKLLIYANLDRELDQLEKKSRDLACRGHRLAAIEANAIVHNLRNVNCWYFEEEKFDYAHYRYVALSIINQGRSELEKHRGYKRLLGNLTVLIFTLGGAFIVNKALNGHYLFFEKTDSAKQLDEVKVSIKEAYRLHAIKGRF